ncbi:hypothetical protein RO3G_02781 [Rhizopus delemar RA 99-880]|uniref:RWD domain-containing protein n=1 Tax=Rhizopus delemar (strain RA 99-880 / ATCC MYA-4621 / FGSC 9543 / NRRL 43880) TaxID=246409 RepID=I1BPE7_RHIO9|nr:hypothetical protein RO3G_02781 [Rhizopus delemar RA 99-880]|eukprot:EIE78077.1 hypothetical protein RO3G_02781 [Rhizopus delemar RA 99-880]
MNKEQELENREKQEQELEALEAIFPDDFKKDTTSSDAYTFTIHLDQEESNLRSPRQLTLKFFLPPTYPNQDMPVYEVVSVYCGPKKVDDIILDAIDQGFQSLFEPTEVVLFEWISWLREYLEENVPKSTTHVAKVDTIHQVKLVIACLLQNKKIAKATHNILAYRITMPDGKVLQDNDDDGETAAGENVVVVVTRWFGGIHLGPDRFKDINNIARTTLEEHGFVKQQQSKANNKKSKK